MFTAEGALKTPSQSDYFPSGFFADGFPFIRILPLASMYEEYTKRKPPHQRRTGTESSPPPMPETRSSMIIDGPHTLAIGVLNATCGEFSTTLRTSWWGLDAIGEEIVDSASRK